MRAVQSEQDSGTDRVQYFPIVIRLVDALRVSGVMAVLYGVFSMIALPRTPPKRDAENPLAFARAFGMLRHPGFAVVTLVALPISMIHSSHFVIPPLNRRGYK